MHDQAVPTSTGVAHLGLSHPVDGIVNDRATAHVPAEVGRPIGILNRVSLHTAVGHLGDDEPSLERSGHDIVDEGHVRDVGNETFETIDVIREWIQQGAVW